MTYALVDKYGLSPSNGIIPLTQKQDISLFFENYLRIINVSLRFIFVSTVIYFNFIVLIVVSFCITIELLSKPWVNPLNESILKMYIYIFKIFC